MSQLLFFFLAVCFSMATTQGRLLFEGGIYFVEKPADSNDAEVSAEKCSLVICPPYYYCSLREQDYWDRLLLVFGEYR